MAMATRRCGHARALILYLKNAGRGTCGGRRAVAGANDFDVIRLCSHSLVLDSTIRLSGMRQMTKLVTSIFHKHAQYSGNTRQIILATWEEPFGRALHLYGSFSIEFSVGKSVLAA